MIIALVTPPMRWLRFAENDDQVEGCRRIFASDTLWTVVRGSALEEGKSNGLSLGSRRVGDPVLASNLTKRTDFALSIVHALTNDALIHEASAIVGRTTRRPERISVPLLDLRWQPLQIRD